MPSSDYNSPHESSSMSLGDHIEELRKRLILAVLGAMVGIGIGLCYTSSAISWLRAPYEKVMKDANLDPHLQSLNPTDGFTTYMQIAMWFGLVLASPWIIYQLWKFVSAGLYPKERRYVYAAAPATAILFVLGVLLAVIVIAPMTLQFLVTFNRDWLGVASAFTFQSYMSFMVSMMLAFGLAFETPIVMFFLNKFGILPLSLITKSRRYVILIVVILAAVLTPGSDLISLAALAIPLYLLFELGVILIWLFGRKTTI
jgi:sec-independent protein translocase protein TatC